MSLTTPPVPTGAVYEPARYVPNKGWAEDYAHIIPARSEADPTGKSPHTPGAKVDAGKPRFALVLGSMARAVRAVVEVGTFGAVKYTEDGWLAVPNGFKRYEDAQMRHAFYRHAGENYDPDSQLLHLAHEAWNAMAKLELYLREQERAKS